jgi:predicted DNA-binding transcriptional regulator AlpA
MTNTHSEDQLLLIEEVATITRMSIATLRWRRHCGLPPNGFKLGRRVVYRRRDIRAWIDGQAGGPAA